MHRDNSGGSARRADSSSVSASTGLLRRLQPQNVARAASAVIRTGSEWLTWVCRIVSRFCVTNSNVCSCFVTLRSVNMKTGRCPVTPHCAGMKRLWKHIAECKDQKCLVPHCVSSRYVLSHYHRCKDVRCPVCGPVREAIHRSHEKQKHMQALKQRHQQAVQQNQMSAGASSSAQAPAATSGALTQPAQPVPAPSANSAQWSLRRNDRRRSPMAVSGGARVCPASARGRQAAGDTDLRSYNSNSTRPPESEGRSMSSVILRVDRRQVRRQSAGACSARTRLL